METTASDEPAGEMTSFCLNSGLFLKAGIFLKVGTARSFAQ